MSTPVTSIQMGMGWQAEQAGGLNRLFSELVQRLPAQGVGVRGLVVGSPDVERESQGMVRAFAPASAPIWRRLRAARAAVRALAPTLPAQGRVVLVSHFAPYGLGLLGAARRFPLVVYFHGPWSEESRTEGRGWLSMRIRHALERRVYLRAERCIVLSQAFARVLERDFGVAPERISVIPGGVDVARFAALPPRAEARRALGWDADAPTVLTVRRLVRRTGVDRLIAAVPALRARVPGVRVIIAGDGPERAALEAQARALGVSDTVRFLGFVPEEQLPLAYRAADLSVVPSFSLEGFGLIVPESLAAGTPVLVSPVGGLPETVDGLSRESILRDSTPTGIAEGVADALTGVRVLPNAERCAQFARERFDWSVVARRVAELLTQVAR
jgi:glycosyltransferase involved in cell wall biosynthesis